MDVNHRLTAHLSGQELLCPPWSLQQSTRDHVDKLPTFSSFSYLLSHLHASLCMTNAPCH